MKIFQPNLEQFDAARADLAALLLDAVADGASLGFLAALTQTEACAYWCEIRAAMQTDARLLWLAERDGKIVGTVQMELCQKKNGVNRAEIQKLLVYSEARHRGLGQQLIQALEQAAKQHKRGLLYLDTEAGSEAEAFYSALGYTRVGELPNYCATPDGRYKATAIYFKTLGQPE